MRMSPEVLWRTPWRASHSALVTGSPFIVPSVGQFPRSRRTVALGHPVEVHEIEADRIKLADQRGRGCSAAVATETRLSVPLRAETFGVVLAACRAPPARRTWWGDIRIGDESEYGRGFDGIKGRHGCRQQPHRPCMGPAIAVEHR